MRIRIVPGGPMLVDGVPVSRLAHVDDAFTLAPIEPARATPVSMRAIGRAPLCDKEPPYACFEEEPPDGLAPGPFHWDVPDPPARRRSR
jgi:hypothetical protein